VGGNRQGTFAGFLFPALFFFIAILWSISFIGTSHIPLFIAIGASTVFIFTFLFSKDRERTLFTNVNLLTTMLLGGLWHGASLRFIIWGALHGIALAVHKIVLEYFPAKTTKKVTFFGAIWTFIAVVITFHFVTFCWIFFRAKDFVTAIEVIQNIGKVTLDPNQWMVIISGYKNVFLLMGIGFIWHFLPENLVNFIQRIFKALPLLFKAIVLGFVFWIVYATASAGPQPFIYFQF
jgi:D-alanyl-lipoteichoic acid acyltransferase DltB (MBOAT superfamily)